MKKGKKRKPFKDRYYKRLVSILLLYCTVLTLSLLICLIVLFSLMFSVSPDITQAFVALTVSIMREVVELY